MTTIRIPKLESKYIPVHGGYGHFVEGMNWWSNTSPFIYPNGLFNLMQFTEERLDEIRKHCPDDFFILTDSGGFQIITGKCNLTWETSLLKQIKLKASKIFALDTPPLKPKFKGSLNQFIYMNNEETIKLINSNIDVAIKQSLYLAEKYPEDRKRFCYILHGHTLDEVNYNINQIDKKIGKGNFNEYFPGGIVYAPKESDLLAITITARHAYETFIKKGIYVHFLGMGSFNRMIVLIRNKISTFDSSSILQGVRMNDFINPINLNRRFQLSSQDLNNFVKDFCTCPVCLKYDYFKAQKENQVDIGRYCTLHNLWHMLKMNIFLDAIKLSKYTNTVTSNFKIKDNVKKCLDFCDDCDKIGFDLAYNKYKHYLKKDETKQKSLF